MGFSPQQIDEMSPWQFYSCCNGYSEAHSVEDGKLSKGEADDIWNWMEDKTDAPATFAEARKRLH